MYLLKLFCGVELGMESWDRGPGRLPVCIIAIYTGNDFFACVATASLQIQEEYRPAPFIVIVVRFIE